LSLSLTTFQINKRNRILYEGKWGVPVCGCTGRVKTMAGGKFCKKCFPDLSFHPGKIMLLPLSLDLFGKVYNAIKKTSG
jgi:hypothetical protein